MPTTSVDGQLLQCIYCPMGYSSLAALERHMRQLHSSLPGTDNPALSALSAQLTGASMVNTEGKLLLPPKSMTPTLPLGRGKILHQPRPIKPKSVSATLLNLQDKIKQNLKRDSKARSPSGEFLYYAEL